MKRRQKSGCADTISIKYTKIAMQLFRKREFFPSESRAYYASLFFKAHSSKYKYFFEVFEIYFYVLQIYIF